MRLDNAQFSDRGARDDQQDLAASYPIGEPAHPGVMIALADGAGGAAHGGDAARIAVEAALDYARSGAFDEPARWPDALRQMALDANRAIADFATSHDGETMGTTLVVALFARGRLGWLSIGDSHLYLYRAGALKKLNEDHSKAAILVENGLVEPDDPRLEAFRHELVSALHGGEITRIDLPETLFELAKDDFVLLASDGLDTLDLPRIAQALEESAGRAGEFAARALIGDVLAKKKDDQDNVTVAVARVLDPGVSIDAAPVDATPASSVPETGLHQTAAQQDAAREKAAQEISAAGAAMAADPATDPATERVVKPAASTASGTASQTVSGAEAEPEAKTKAAAPPPERAGADPETHKRPIYRRLGRGGAIAAGIAALVLIAGGAAAYFTGILPGSATSFADMSRSQRISCMRLMQKSSLYMGAFQDRRMQRKLASCERAYYAMQDKFWR